MPALQPYIIESLWQQFEALLPEREVDHPLGCHRPRVPDRVVFGKLVEVLIFGCAYWRIAEEGCSATTLRRRRDEWIEAGVMDEMEGIALESYDRMVGLELSDVSVDACITKAPRGGSRAGRSPVDRGKQGVKRCVAVDARGIPLGVLAAPANRHEGPLLCATLDAAEKKAAVEFGEWASVHLDRAYDSKGTRRLLEERGLSGVIARRGAPTPLTAGLRWIVERTNSWHNAHKKLVWCTEREGKVMDFWIALSNVVIVVRRLVREGWLRYRWEGRPSRKP